MKRRFDKHYTRDEARALLPQIRQWLEQLNRHRRDLERLDKRLTNLAADGHDIGGETVNNWIRTLTGIPLHRLSAHGKASKKKAYPLT